MGCLNLPFSDIVVVNDLRWNFPRTRQTESVQSLEIELAAHFWIGSTGMRHIVRVEWHHMGEEFRVAGGVYRQSEKLHFFQSKVYKFSSNRRKTSRLFLRNAPSPFTGSRCASDPQDRFLMATAVDPPKKLTHPTIGAIEIPILFSVLSVSSPNNASVE